MLCPHCNKEINSGQINASVKLKILNALSKSPQSISCLSKTLAIKRSTLNYYLFILKAEGKIQSKRVEEKLTGRPTIISLNMENNN